MRFQRCTRLAAMSWLLTMLITFAVPASAGAQDPPGTQKVVVAVTPADPVPSLEIYGFAMLDIGHDFKSDQSELVRHAAAHQAAVVRGQFGEDNNTFAGVRQSRLGVRANFPTDAGELKTIFEFELFGTGVDEGQTTFRLRHA